MSFKVAKIKLAVESIKGMIEIVRHPVLKLAAVEYIGVLVSNIPNEEIDYFDIVIDAKLVPHLVRFLKDDVNIAIQLEACWALSNIAGGNSRQTRAVVNAGAVPCFVALLRSPNDCVINQAMSALGNIAGDGVECRDIVLESGAVDELNRLLERDNSMTLIIRRQVAWLMSNICRLNPEFHKIEKVLPCLVKLLKQDEDEEVLSDVCSSLACVASLSKEQIQMIIDLGCVDRLVQLLECDNVKVLRPAVRAVGIIVTGNDTQTDVVLDANVLPVIEKLLSHEDTNVVKGALWLLSNIAAGEFSQYKFKSELNNLLFFKL